MKLLNVCLSFSVNYNAFSPKGSLESKYQNVFKKLISCIYSNPSSKMAFHFSGPQIEWLEKEHPEFLQLLRELVAKKQIEMVGGGYYNPVFPLLFPVDRSGQIELLTAEIRRLTGKRPRGMNLLASVWDNSLISCFQNSGMEWIFLDSSLIAKENRYFLPQIVNDQGKSIKVIPVSRSFTPKIEDNKTPQTFINELLKFVEKNTKSDIYSKYVDERVVSINIEVENMESLLKEGWLENFFETVKREYSSKIKLCLPTEYISNAKEFVLGAISPGFRADIAKWAIIPYQQVEVEESRSYTIHNFLLTYAPSRALYNRMLYISTLILNCRGDKARKNAARQSLWKAEHGEALICSPEGIFANNSMRQYAYRHLTEAEKFIREAAPFKEAVTSYDYDFDGHNDYVCSMEKYTACINPYGAEVNELNIITNTGNYADNLSRHDKFENQTDEYRRGLFVEHILTKEEFAEYKKGNPTNCGVFSKCLFTESDFVPQKKEIKLVGEGSFSNLDIPLSLRKKYIMNSNGFTVQYILRNEGPIELKGIFVVESNFAQTDFSSVSANSYKVDLISSEEGISWDKIAKPVSQKNVSFVQITDTSNDISFVYQPNEEASINCRPLYFKRPLKETTDSEITGTTFVSSLYWEVNLLGGLEMEKTINFSIITPKKRRSKEK